jgi:hypothetical protein
MTRRLCPTIALAVAALLAAGCGGQSPLSRAALVQRADAICKRIGARRAVANATVGSVTTQHALKELVHVVPAVVFYERKAIAEMRKLKPPTTLSADWQKLLVGAQERANNTVQIYTLAKARNLEGAQAVILHSRPAEQRLAVLARHDGFTRCGIET